MADLGEFEEEIISEPIAWPSEEPAPAEPAVPVVEPEKVPA